MFSRFRLLALLAIVFLASSHAANACSCGQQPTVLESYNGSDVVVIVRVVSVEKAEPEKTAAPGRMSNGENYVDGVKSTTVIVERAFKGTLRVGEKMIFGQGGGADCIWTFNEKDLGKQYLFYLHRYEGATVWIAGTCGRSSNAESAADDLLYLNNLDKVRGKTRISGTFSFDIETGDSVAGRKIRIAGAGHTYEVKTDRDGVYEIYDVPAGEYLVEPEVPRGWRVARFWLGYSPSFAGNDDNKSLKKIPIVVADKQHAGLDIRLEIDNAVRGHIYDPLGRPMNGVCLDLVPADGTTGAFLMGCTEKDGAFEIDEIPPGGYIIVVNDDGKVTSSEPFGTFYYPTTTKREDATVFHIGLGDFIENLQIYPPVTAETITVEGVCLYSDGKLVAGERVSFKSAKTMRTGKNDEDGEDDARAETDSKGRFSIKILKGTKGLLSGEMYTYVGAFENCPKLDRLIKETGKSSMEVRTPAVEIFAQTNLNGVVLKYPFPGCKKAKEE